MMLMKLFCIHILQLIPNFLMVALIHKNQMVFHIYYEKLLSVFTFLSYYTNCQVDYLSDICAVDYPQRLHRFELIYSVLSLAYNVRFRIKCSFSEFAILDSLAMFYISADWFERELWDMLGIQFYDHYRLRRILTDYGFTGHPLRKEFPHSGLIEVRFSEQIQKVTYEPVQVAARARCFA